MYDLGKVTSPPAVLFSSLSFFYLAYRTYPFHASGQNEWKLYLAAGTVVFSVLPFTFGVLEATNHALLRIGKRHAVRSKEGDEERIRALIESWKVLNLVRSGILIVGAGIGMYAVMS